MSAAHFPCSWLLMACLVIASSPVLADRVRLANGDTLTGAVVGLADGKLTLKTDYAGDVAIAANQIVALTTDAPVELRTQQGEVLKGRVESLNEGVLGVAGSEGREPVRVAWPLVAAINPPPVGLWHGNFTLGANLQSGNTDRRALSAGVAAERRTERDRIGLDYLYNSSHEDGELIGRNHYGSAKYDYFYSKRLYGYLSLGMLKDSFQDLRLRTIVGPGMGYQVWDTPDRSLSLEAGISYVSEDLIVGQDNDYATGRLGVNYRQVLFKVVTFSNRLILYPSFEDTNAYTLRNEAALATALGAQWSLNLSNILQYDNEPAVGVGSTDSQWILGLQYRY